MSCVGAYDGLLDTEVDGLLNTGDGLLDTEAGRLDTKAGMRSSLGKGGVEEYDGVLDTEAGLLNCDVMRVLDMLLDCCRS